MAEEDGLAEKPKKKEKGRAASAIESGSQAFGEGMQQAARDSLAVASQPINRGDQPRYYDYPKLSGSFKRGGTAKKSGLYRLHKGEKVAGRSMKARGGRRG